MLAGLRDPRMPMSYEHLLFDIVSISILTAVCGADDWTDLEMFENKRRPWLAVFLKLPMGFRRMTRFVACSDCSTGRSSRRVCCNRRRRCTMPG